MRDLAERVLPVYQDSDADRYLANLSAMQLIAGDYAAADASRQSLRERRAQSGEPAGSGTILDIFARAKAVQGQTHAPFAQTFAKAYQDVVAHLDDHDAYAVAQWLQTPPQVAREGLQTLLSRQRSVDTISEDDAIKLLWAYAYYDAYRALAPLVAPLIAADDARRYATDNEVLIRVRGRPTIHVHAVRPKSASGPLPSLLELSLDPSRNLALEYAAHGYAGVAAYVQSGRNFVPYQHDGAAARAVIDWIARQGWSDGRVAMIGEGYSGFTAWAAAAQAPAALKAIATSAPSAPGIDAPMSGGIFQNSAYRWSLEVRNSRPALDQMFSDDAVWRALNEKWYRSGRRYRDLGRLFGRPDPIFIRWLNHPSYDRFWQTMIPYAAQFGRIAIPVLTTTGYFDAREPAALYYFSQQHRYNAHADHTLLIGPYDDAVIRHGSLTSAVMRDYEVDAVARLDLRELRYQWLDHVLKDGPLPAQLTDRVNYEVMGANEWRHASSLAALGATPQRFYLDTAASGDGHRLSGRKSSRLAAITQTVSLTDRSDAGWLPPSDLISQSLVTRNAVLFASAPLPNSVQLSGLLSGHLDFVVNKMDMDLNIALYELKAGGDYLRLFDPAFELRLSYAQDRVHRHLLKAGERQQIAFTCERMTSRQLDKGSRLVMVLRIAKRPDREINYGTGQDVSEESIADGKVPIKVRWFNDSFIEAPMHAPTAAHPAEPHAR